MADFTLKYRKPFYGSALWLPLAVGSFIFGFVAGAISDWRKPK